MSSPGDARARSPVERPPARDLGLLVVAIAAVSTSAPLIAATVAPALAVAFWRNAFAAGLLLLVSVASPARRREFAALPARSWWLSAAGGVLLAGHFATWVPSLRFTSVASSTALVATQPVWAAVIARLQGFPVPRAVWWGIALALAGVVLLTGIDVSVSLRAFGGDALALAGAVFAAFYMTVGGTVRQSMTTVAYTTVCYGTTTVVLGLVCLAVGAAFTGYPGSTWLELAALTAGPQLLGHSVFNRVLATTSPTAVSLSILFEVPGAALIAAVALHQHLRLAAVPALLLLLAGVAVVVRAGIRAQPLE